MTTDPVSIDAIVAAISDVTQGSVPAHIAEAIARALAAMGFLRTPEDQAVLDAHALVDVIERILPLDRQGGPWGQRIVSALADAGALRQPADRNVIDTADAFLAAEERLDRLWMIDPNDLDTFKADRAVASAGEAFREAVRARRAAGGTEAQQ